MPGQGLTAKLGIMQGRLVPPDGGRFQSFPRERWRDEFELVSAAGLDTIEWIYDAHGEDVNPLGTDTGLTELRALSAQYRVGVESVCADWFMDYPLLRVEPTEAQRRWQRLRWLVERCAMLDINRVVLPFVDASSIRSTADTDQLITEVRSITDRLEALNVELHLETSLAPAPFAALLAKLDHPRVKVNYDSGNSASLGFDPADEFGHYGQRVGSVHLKDRRLNGGTVPLGDGDADFDSLFTELATIDYRGDFILQVARGESGQELEWARRNAATARALIGRLGTTPERTA